MIFIWYDSIDNSTSMIFFMNEYELNEWIEFRPMFLKFVLKNFKFCVFFFPIDFEDKFQCFSCSLDFALFDHNGKLDRKNNTPPENNFYY